jgi:hypothetical protein
MIMFMIDIIVIYRTHVIGSPKVIMDKSKRISSRKGHDMAHNMS